MKKIIIALATGFAALSAVPGVANAAPWQSINQRQANLDRRIDQGIRSGDLTRREATRLREQFADLSRLERQYRRSGGRLTVAERQDLDVRFDRLSQRIYAQRHDRQDRVGRY